tara:strand:+ start:123 stop:284 length:162 start_codon:yes stop_codon:yes gene_type:complete
MNQLILDYLCSIDVEGLTDDNTYYASEFISTHFDSTEIYEQIDRLLELYLAKK